MTTLSGTRVLVGVCGGIAAYKAADLVRLLVGAGAEVRVVMTHAATAFVAPLTFQALSGHAVHVELLDADREAAMGHISLARWAEAVIVAPATADFIAKLRAGLADDLLSTLCLAAEVPVSVVPAMNRAMWANAATSDNVDTLRRRGVRILGPGEGSMACGETGFGRMLEPAEILDRVFAQQPRGPLAGVRVLVSAGPTREAIDPVRYITNRSSGKMGYAVARAAAEAGATVALVTGPVTVAVPAGMAEVVGVESAAEMRAAVMARAPNHDIYIGAAAVADFAPVGPSPEKMKKQEARTVLTLERTRDILAEVAALEQGPFTVGFAAETKDLEQYARGKLRAKSLDMIAANWVGRGEGGFDSDENALLVLWPGGQRTLPLASKTALARDLVELIAENYHAHHTG